MEEIEIEQIRQAFAALVTPIQERIDEIFNRLGQREVKETYTIEEVANRLEKGVWTVRQWCNKGQVKGAKKVHGRGRTGEWRIPHAEIVRLQNEGPLRVA